MTTRFTLRHSAIIAAILCGTSVSADVTAQQVWDNWKDQMDIYGEGFTVGSEEMSGDTLTVSGISINMADDEAAVTADLGTVTLTENGDGTVSIMTPASYPMVIDLTPEYGDPSTINMSFSQDGMELIVSGDPGAMVYDLTAARYAISIDSLEGQAAENVALQDATIAMLDIAGQYSVAQDNLTRIGYVFDMGALDIDVLFREVGGNGVVEFNGDIADLSMAAKMATPIGMTLEDMDQDQPPFSQGLSFDGGYSFADMAYSFNIDADGEKVSGDVTVEQGDLTAAMDVDGLSYQGQSTGLDLSFLAPNEFPLPIEATMAAYGFDFQIPLSQGDGGVRDARVAMNFNDLAISDVIWGLIDPQAILPRDPISLVVGLDAQVTPFFDFLDPEQQQAAMMADVPGELNGAQITDLLVRGAGAEITGEGAFTFDNTDLMTFDGLPRPEGEVTFNINGINGLIDNLIQMGLVPEDQAMMPRMMMGMFTTPVGDDMLTSTIEINSEGHILANGQRLR